MVRNAWLTAGLPLEVPATTVNVQCGSAQQATTLAHTLVGSGLIDVAVACGVENMSMVPMGSSIPAIPTSERREPAGTPRSTNPTTQLEGSDRIAAKWGIGRDELDAFGLRSQRLGAQAWAEDRFAGQIAPIRATILDDEGRPSGTTKLRA